MTQLPPELPQSSSTEDHQEGEGIYDGSDEVKRETESDIEGSDTSSKIPSPNSMLSSEPTPSKSASSASAFALGSIPTSASDILRPLSEVAAQRSFPLPTSGSLASLARHQGDHADGGQPGDYHTARTIAATADTTRTRRGGSSSSSLMPEQPLQSDSHVDATTTTAPSHRTTASTITPTDAVQQFISAVWDTPTTNTMVVSATTGTATSSASTSKPSQDTPVYSPSPQSAALAESSSGREENSLPLTEDPQIIPSPYASIFPEGTSTYPLVIQRRSDDESDTSLDTEAVLKYSESLQIFRRRSEDGGKLWKRRVFEYR